MPFVYALVDPLEPAHLRYIGVATKKDSRPFFHMNVTKTITPGSQYDTAVHRWIMDLQKEGRNAEVKIVIQFPEGTSRKEMFAAEKNLMRYAARVGHQLFNYHETWARDECEGKHRTSCDPVPDIVVLNDINLSTLSDHKPAVLPERLVLPMHIPMRRTATGGYQYEIEPGRWVNRQRLSQIRKTGTYKHGQSGRPRKYFKP